MGVCQGKECNEDTKGPSLHDVKKAHRVIMKEELLHVAENSVVNEQLDC